MEGLVPEPYRMVHGQTIELLIDGRTADRRRVEAGPFRFTVPVERKAGLLDVELRSDRYFVPRRVGLGEDGRRLSYLLDRICWVP